jgi:hypothetical protein
MKPISLQRLAQLIGFTIVIAGLPFESHIARAQYPPKPFPVLQVDSVVRARLAEEWEPGNRYQHERGYCVRYVADTIPATWFQPSVVVYTLVGIIRANEIRTTQGSIGGIECPPRSDITVLHIHPPYFCTRNDDGSSCSQWDVLAHQCFPSPTDARSLLQSSRPFDLIQCDQFAIVPYWHFSG